MTAGAAPRIAEPCRLPPVGHGDEPPRERLRRRGLRALCDAEVVALLLSAGRTDAGDLEQAREVLRHGGLAGLLRLDESWLHRSDLGECRAAALLAGVELGRRLARVRVPERRPLKRPDLAADYLILRYQGCDQEIMGALYLDVRERLIAEREIYRGTLLRASVDYREILKQALYCGAVSFFLFHTHPSGDPTPSCDDMAFTWMVAEAAGALGISFLDHFVLGSRGRWVSIRARRGSWF